MNKLKKLSRNEIKEILENIIIMHEQMVINSKDLLFIRFVLSGKPIDRKNFQSSHSIKEKFYTNGAKYIRTESGIKKNKTSLKITFYLHCSTTVTQKQILYHGMFTINKKPVTIDNLKDILKRLNHKKSILT